MKKVLTMTLNPCVDRTIYFDDFQVGGTNIVKRVIEEAAGKGINVAVGLKHLQVPVKALGFAYKTDADMLYEKLEEEQVEYQFVEVDGRLRVNQKIFDESKQQMTECNEKGCGVAESDVESLLILLQRELEDAALLVLSGSVPPGVNKDIYAKMITMAKQFDVKVILDANGDLLREGVKAGPYLIKPNKEEFVKTFGDGRVIEKLEEDGIEKIAESIMEQGVEYICLSMGAYGAVMMKRSANEMERRPAISVQVRSLQGAGDAMVAGLCKAIYEGTESRMLEYAMTMAASTIMLEGTTMGSGIL